MTADPTSLEGLLSALEGAQRAPPSSSSNAIPRLGDRNAVELVSQLRALGLLSADELHHTSDGRAYVTAERLREDARAALKNAGGRLEVAELPNLLGVDLGPCERAAAALVAASARGGGKNETANDTIELHHGELFTPAYFDGVAAEVDALLQEQGRLALADVAAAHSLAGELVARLVRERCCGDEAAGGKTAATTTPTPSVIRGRLDGAALYTPAHVRRAKAALRGALRGALAPAAVAALARGAGVELPGGGGGATGGATTSATTTTTTLVEELVAEGAVRGHLAAGAWTPKAHSDAQAGAARAFFEQNGWIGYESARRLGLLASSSATGSSSTSSSTISDVRAALLRAFPDGRALGGAFVSAAVAAQAEAAAEEALASGGWVDAASVLPGALSSEDAAQLLSEGAAFRAAVAAAGGGGVGGSAGGAKKGKASKAAASAAAAASSSADPSTSSDPPPVVLAGTCVFSGPCLARLRAAVEQSAREAASAAAAAARKQRQQQQGAAAATKKTVSFSPNTAGDDDDDDDDDWSRGGGKKKGGGKGGKGGKGKGGGKAGGGGSKGASSQHQPDPNNNDDNNEALSPETLVAVIIATLPDVEDAGEAGSAPDALAEMLRPFAAQAHAQALSAALNAGAEARRLAKESAARLLDEAFSRLQLYLRGAREVSGVGKVGGGGEGGEEEEEEDKAAAEGGALSSAGAAANAEAHSTLALLARHAARTTGGEALDALLRWCELEFFPEEEEEEQAMGAERAYTPAERQALLGRLGGGGKKGGGGGGAAAPAALVAALRRAAEQVAGGGGQATTPTESTSSSSPEEAAAEAAEASAAALETALEEGAGELGLRLRRLDKKATKAAAAAAKARLMAALSAEQSPPAALSLALPLLALKATRGRAVVSVPGRAIAPVLARLRGGLEEEAFSLVAAFHRGVVAALTKRSGGGAEGEGEEEEEELRAKLPALKALVGIEGEVGEA